MTHEFICDGCSCTFRHESQSVMKEVCKKCYRDTVREIKKKIGEAGSCTAQACFESAVQGEENPDLREVEFFGNAEIDDITERMDKEKMTWGWYFNVWKCIQENGAWEVERDGYICE